MEMQAIYKEGEVHLQTTVIDNQCAYTRHPDTGQPYTVTEYLETLGPDFTCIPLEDALDKIAIAQELAFIKPWFKISKKVWMLALEVLPPMRWAHVQGIEFFQCSEMTIGNITATYARIGNKFFTADRRTSDDYSYLAGEIGLLV